MRMTYEEWFPFARRLALGFFVIFVLSLAFIRYGPDLDTAPAAFVAFVLLTSGLATVFVTLIIGGVAFQRYVEKRIKETSQMMTTAEFTAESKRLLTEVQYLDYQWEVREDPGHGLLMRARYTDLDIYTKKPETQYTAWVSVSIKSGFSRVVSGAMKLALTSAEHRCREAFTYRGRRIFGPHFHMHDLYDLCKDREDAGQ